MATGDMEGNLERLRVQLRTIGYPHPPDINGLKEGNPVCILPLLHYALLGYSRHVAQYLSENGYALFAKSDLRFVECLLKFLREDVGYRCSLTVAQILSRGFAERKFLFVHDVIQICKKKHTELAKRTRQQAHARKALKRDPTTMSEFSKHIDLTNIDALHMDETISLALEKASEAPELTSTGRSPNKSQAKAAPQRQDTLMETRRSHDMMDQQTPLSSFEPNTNNEITMRTNKAMCSHTSDNVSCQHKELSPSRNNDSPNTRAERRKSTNSANDTDSSLSHCYQQLRTQIIEVAENLEKQLIQLKNNVEKLTNNMQVKLAHLQRQTQHLEQALPSRHLVGRMAASYENPYDRSNPRRRLDEGSLQIPVSNPIWDIGNSQQNHMGFVNLDIPQTQPPNVMQAHHPHQQLSTQELIASVRARCNQTKEMLMGSGWIGPT